MATAAPRQEEDDEERRGRRGASLLRGAGFRARGRLRSPPASLSKCGGDAGGLPDLLTPQLGFASPSLPPSLPLPRPEQSVSKPRAWVGGTGAFVCNRCRPANLAAASDRAIKIKTVVPHLKSLGQE